MMNKLYQEFRHLILYGIIGCFSSGLDFLLYTVLVSYWGMFYLVANCISVMAGISTSFLLNRQYNFKVKDQIGKRFTMFLTVGLTGLLLSNMILFVLIDTMQLDELIAKLTSIVWVVVFQYLMNRFITFEMK